MDKLLGFLALLAVVNSVLCTYSIQVSIDKPTVYPGDSVKVTCSISAEASPDDDGSFMIHWVKRVPEDPADVEMASNIYSNDDFSTDRYAFTTNMDPNAQEAPTPPFSLEFYLDITDAQVRDSGEIGCKIKGIEVFEKLVVIEDIASLEFGSESAEDTEAGTFIDGSTKEFDEGEQRLFWCMAEGSYPAPQVDIFLGDNNITSSFSRDTQLVKDGAIRGLSDLRYQVRMENPALVIDYAADGKRLECRARVPNQDRYEERNIGIDVQLNGYKPKFKCSNTQQAGEYQAKFNLTCLVVANPPVIDTSIGWMEMGENNETVRRGLHTSVPGEYTISVDPLTNVETHMTIIIDRVFNQYFREYYFEAENELGRTSHIVALERDVGRMYDIETGELVLGDSAHRTQNMGLMMTALVLLITYVLTC